MFDKYRFNLAASVKSENADENNLTLRAISLDDTGYTNQLQNDWYKQYYTFLFQKSYVDFRPGDDVEEDELVLIEDFDLPPYIKEYVNDSSDISDLPSIKHRHIERKTIKSILGVTRYQNRELILFQKFRDSTQLPGKQLTLSLDTDSLVFKKVSDPLLTLGDSLIAVYEIEEKKLIFRRFNDVSYILEMDRYFKMLSSKEIMNFLRHNLFEADISELDDIINDASPLLAKRFALVKDSGILNRVSAEIVESVSLKYKNVIGYSVNVELSTDRKKIIFPTQKAEAHNLLRLLNQDFYTGDFDGDPFLARSKRSLK